jgi:hypothetical protein
LTIKKTITIIKNKKEKLNWSDSFCGPSTTPGSRKEKLGTTQLVIKILGKNNILC